MKTQKSFPKMLKEMPKEMPKDRIDQTLIFLSVFFLLLFPIFLFLSIFLPYYDESISLLFFFFCLYSIGLRELRNEYKKGLITKRIVGLRLALMISFLLFLLFLTLLSVLSIPLTFVLAILIFLASLTLVFSAIETAEEKIYRESLNEIFSAATEEGAGISTEDRKWDRVKMEDRAKRERWKQKITELKRLIEETEIFNEKNYGPPTNISPINQQEFQSFLTSIDRCQVEGRVVFAYIRNRSLDELGYERETAELSSGKEVVQFLEQAMNGKLNLLFLAKCSFYNIPFSVEYRQKEGKGFVHLLVVINKPSLGIARYDFFVREK